MGRTIVMFLSVSEIHDASQKPLEMVRTITSNVWCTEVIFDILLLLPLKIMNGFLF